MAGFFYVQPMKSLGLFKTFVGSLLSIVILVLHSDFAVSQETTAYQGIPYYQTYLTRDYPGEQQMFDVIQWYDGSMLFANAGGLVQHADDDWRIFARFDATFISELERSVVNPDLIWAGSYSNLGYFIQNEIGEFEYFSLSDQIPENYSDFSEVYAITESTENVHFYSDLYLFIFNKTDSTITVVDENYFENIYAKPVNYISWNDEFYYILSNGEIALKDANAINILDFDGIKLERVILTEKGDNIYYLYDEVHGLLTFDGQSIALFAERYKDFLINTDVSDLRFHDGKIVLATDEGVLVLNKQGEAEYIFNKKTGFLENEINAVYFDQEGDLWVLGQASVTQVYLSVPVRHFPGEALGFGDALHVREFEGSLFIPAMDDFFRLDAPLTELVYKDIDEIIHNYSYEANFWNSLIVDNELWVASHLGVFKVEEDKLITIQDGIESRQLRQLTEDIILIVTYNGLDWLQRERNSWVYKGTIESVPEHILELAVVPDQSFWAGGVSGEVFRGVFNSETGEFDVNRFSYESNLPETDLFEPTYTNNTVIVNSKYGFHQFDPQTESFFPIESINEQLGNWGEYLRMDDYGVMWTQYANIEGYNGVIKISPDDELEWKADFTPFEISQDHFGDFVEIQGNTLWVGSTESILQMDVTANLEHASPEIKLWEIKSNFDQEILSYSNPEPAAIKYEQKDITLSFVSSSFRYPAKNEFRFKVGNDEWSEWRSGSSIAVNPFFPGTHKVSVQTRDFMLSESQQTEFSIRIVAPWYLSNFAYLVYAFTFLGLFILAVRGVATYRIQQQVKDLKLREIERIIELDELKTKLLINISHELRTPLTLVTGPVKQLLDSEKVQDDFLLHKLQVAHRNGRRLHDLVEQVLDLSRLDSNIIHFNPVEIPLKVFIQRVIESFESAIEKKGLKVTTDLPREEILFHADADKLQKILVNLLSNAIKFTPKKGQVDLSLTDILSEIQIVIKDSGRGIEASNLDHVFDRFHSTSDQLEGGGQGIGVGLSITKEFVELHDGRISVESEFGKGAIFKVKLPKKEYGEVAAFIEEPKYDLYERDGKSIPLSVNGKEYSALVIEDNPDMREYISELLSQLNIRVEQAENGIEGKKKMSLINPDIVISDIMMPELNGFEFSEWMRSVPEFKQIPIILLSARSEVEDKVHGFQIGVSDYLTKPFNAQELQARVDNLLVLKKEREEMATKFENDDQPLSADSDLVQQLQEFVESKIDQSDISVEDLANHVAMSSRNLQRTLKSVTGFTPNEFIREVRLFTARDLLETKQKRSISEVAYAVGFSTPAYFSKQYKKRFGTSPAQYF